MPEVRCYNCQGMRHYANVCKKPQRPMGECFKCGRAGHLRVNCPLRTVAAAAEEGELNWNVQVRVALGPNPWRSKLYLISSLIDTGSPCSFINPSIIRFLFPNYETKEERVPNLRGLSGEKVRVYGQRGRIKKINFKILNDSAPCALILGRDFIQLFSIVMYLKGGSDPNEFYETGKYIINLLLNTDPKSELKQDLLNTYDKTKSSVLCSFKD